ncbi:MAG TPA: alpha-2-macroglobulin [Beijerinckiaceae bacterium]|nr:alpha-2-macroglobulin [Beijerinckiaceae bacterium]
MAVTVLSAPVLAQQKSFIREDLASNGIRLEERLKKDGAALASGRPAAQLRQEGMAVLGRDARRALALFGAAIAAEPKSAASWLAYARAAMAIDPGTNYGERYTLRENATTAAYLSYVLANARAEEALALEWLGRAFARADAWRPMLDAYRNSLERADNAPLRALYQEMREKHGFRFDENAPYKVDSDAASPRVCFQFTEALQRGRVDFAPYVAVTGAASFAVSAEDRQLCVDGLKHGERYTMIVRQGLPSSVGEALLKTADYEIYVRDRSPQVRFTGKNYVLPRVGQEGIPVVSVNAQKVNVDIARVGDRSLLPTVRSEEFLNQISSGQAKKFANETGFKIWSGTLDIKSEQNKDITTAFPVLEAVGKLEPGVYVMTAWPESLNARSSGSGNGDDDDYSDRSTQWFVVSDLGLTAVSAADGVHVFSRSLASSKALGGVEMRLVAKNNEILATQKTDSRGYVKFDPGLSRGMGGLEPGMVVATDAGGDYGFLDLQQAAFDLTDRGVKGRAAPGPLDAFVFAERGVYRSGETVQLTTLLRDAKGVAAGGLPLTLVAQRPDGVEYKRVRVEDQGLGGRAYSLALLSGAPRGTWRVKAYADPKGKPIGETSFLVEDYVPERLDVDLKPKEPLLRSGQPTEVDVSVNYLYGAPGADLEVGGEVTVRLAGATTVPGLKDYVTGLDDETFESTTSELEERATTDARGRATVSVSIPEATAPRPLEARIVLRVGESGGRAVERSVVLPIRPNGPVLAVKKLFSDDSLSEGSIATFDVVAATAEGEKLPRNGVQWTLSRVERRYQWYNSDGRWSFEPVKSTRRVADGRIDVTAAAPGRISAPVGWGTYRLEVRADGSNLAPVATTFTVGWSGESTATTPDLLESSLDKPSYKPGDRLQVKLNPRFAGTATVMIVGDGVHDVQLVDVPKEGSSITIPVKAEWGAGAYAVAFAHRPLDQAAQRMPGRALGVAWFSIDQPAQKLAVELGTPEKIRPRGMLSIPVKLTGAAPGDEAYVTVAAVDVGILNLTGYELPDASGHYFGQRQLGADIRDLYGFLIDGMQGTRGAIRSGGDGGKPSLDGAPPQQVPMARYSGVVKVGTDGTAQVEFDIPAFNGTARVMAVAWTRSGVGQTKKDVIIRDPVVIAGTLPRFLNYGDESRFFLQIDNIEGGAGDYTLDLDLRGPVIVAADAARRTVRLNPGGKTSLSIPVKAGGLGTATFDLRMTGPGVDVTHSFNVTVLPGTPEVFQRSVRMLNPQQNVTLSSDLLAEYLPKTGYLSVAVSPFGGMDVPALLRALDRYPYGCSEQIVSRAMPLLYVNRLARAEALSLDPNLDERIKDAIERVLSRQDSSGAFGLWAAGGADDHWLDSYVMDFLTRARERGFVVAQKSFDLALDRLRNHVANTSEVRDGGRDLAYAIYVLARNGRPVMNDLRYLVDTKLSDFTTPLARAQLAAALALLGDRGRAGSVFSNAAEELSKDKMSLSSRSDYGSKLRDGAGILTLAAEANLSRDVLVKTAAVVFDTRQATRYTSTQENAWMVLAAQALVADAQAMALTVNGEAHKGALYRTYSAERLEARPLTIENAGQAPAHLVVSASGNPLVQEPALAQGYRVERDLHKLDGTKVDPTKIKQNDRLVVVLKVTELEARFARLLLVDMLPAGLEIDNPELVEGGSLEGFSWLKREAEPVNTEYRDDRFVAAFHRSGEKTAEFSVAYLVRAVAPGAYVHPPAVIEDMYRPERFGRTAYGRVEVAPARN